METSIKCIAIDDEPIALSVIEQFCSRLGYVELTVFSDPFLGLDAVVSERPDVVLLDVEMNDMSGISIAERIGATTAFIFTTAYPQYALDGFNLDAVDFLHKPFSFERFTTAIEKAVRRIGPGRRERLADSCIVVKQEYANVTVPLAEMMYVEALENYARIFKTDGSCVVSHISLKGLMDMLPSDRFIRVHRSYIVAVDKIVSFTRQSVRLVHDRTIPVGRQYVDGLMACMRRRAI